MSLHKLSAGSGYDYLTRQVAALDTTEKGHTGLASYYTERGESPGVWIGSGMDGIDGLAAGDPVTAKQMRALFGCGLHPLAELRQQQLEGPDLTIEDFQNATRLGVPFKIVDNDLIPFRLEVAKRIAALSTAIGWPADASIAAAAPPSPTPAGSQKPPITSCPSWRNPAPPGRCGMSAPRSNGRSARRTCLTTGQRCWWICWSMTCWIADLSPLSRRVTASTNRKRCGVPTAPRSTAWRERISTPRSGSSTPSSGSSLRPAAATGQPSTSQR
jgi:TrwC relaxase